MVVSDKSPQNQDDLCCLATGGGFGTRRLFTTSDEEVIEIKRPVILNGINDLITAQDLVDRCIIIDLPSIDSYSRKTDKELSSGFLKDYPLIFGGLLDILVEVLNFLPETHIKTKPRMADFALLGAALENVMSWGDGGFSKDYEENRKQSITMAMEHSPACLALIKFMEDSYPQAFSGSYAELYRKLDIYKSETSGWPKSEKGLAGIIKRQAPALAMIGLNIQFDSIRKRDRWHIRINKAATDL